MQLSKRGRDEEGYRMNSLKEWLIRFTGKKRKMVMLGFAIGLWVGAIMRQSVFGFDCAISMTILCFIL